MTYGVSEAVGRVLGKPRLDEDLLHPSVGCRDGDALSSAVGKEPGTGGVLLRLQFKLTEDAPDDAAAPLLAAFPVLPKSVSAR